MENTISISAGMPQLSETRKERLEHFALLAAVLPWFNPDILHKLYVNIFEVLLPEHNGYYKRIATCADLIHSPFVERIDTNVFEIEYTVRTELRDQMLDSSLNKNETTNHSTTVWIAEFMHAYVLTNQHHFLSLKYIESFKVEANLLINPNAETKRIAESLNNKIAESRNFDELKKTIRYYREFLDNDKNQDSQLLNVIKGIEEYEEGSNKMPDGFKNIKKASAKSSIYNFKLPKEHQKQIAKYLKEQSANFLHLYINNLDGHKHIEAGIQNHLEKIEGIELVSVAGECDYKVNIFNNTIYYTVPEEDYRPLNEQLVLDIDPNREIINAKVLRSIVNYLNETLPYFKNWNYLNKLENKKNKLTNGLNPIDIRYSNNIDWIEPKEENIFSVELKSISQKKEPEVLQKSVLQLNDKIEYDIQITNRTESTLHIFALTLLSNLRIIAMPFSSEIFKLEAGGSRMLGGYIVPTSMGHSIGNYKKLYNWKEECAHIKFIYSESSNFIDKINPDTFKQHNVAAPLQQIQVVGKHNSPTILNKNLQDSDVNWATQKITIKLKNPDYNIIPDELNNNWEAYQNNKTIFPFLEKLYPQIEAQKTKSLYALFVGIDDYGVSNLEPLRACKKDVLRFQEFLNNNKNEATYFNFTTLEDREATRENIIQAIVDINHKITEDDTFFFYYAGYGLSESTIMQLDNSNTKANFNQTLQNKSAPSLKCYSGNNNQITTICIEEIQRLANSNLKYGDVSHHKKIMVFDCNFNDNPNPKVYDGLYLKDRNILNGIIDTERTLDFTFGGTVENVNTQEAYTNGVSIYAGDRFNVEETEEFGIFTNALIHHLSKGSKTTYGEIQTSLQDKKYAQSKLPYGERLRFPYVQYSNSIANMQGEHFLEEFLQTQQDEASKRIMDAKENDRKELDLSNLELEEIPEEVFELQQLEALDISGNKLEHIPDGIGQLKNLKRLIAFENNFSARNAISMNLGELEKLRFILMYKCQLTVFPKGILQLKNLDNLQLEGNEIKFIPAELKELKKLVNIDLRNNPILNLPEEIFDDSMLSANGLRIYYNFSSIFSDEISKGKNFEEASNIAEKNSDKNISEFEDSSEAF